MAFHGSSQNRVRPAPKGAQKRHPGLSGKPRRCGHGRASGPRHSHQAPLFWDPRGPTQTRGRIPPRGLPGGGAVRTPRSLLRCDRVLDGETGQRASRKMAPLDTDASKPVQPGERLAGVASPFPLLPGGAGGHRTGRRGNAAVHRGLREPGDMPGPWSEASGTAG